MHTPTQSTPGGCFIGTLALFPFGVAVLGAYGIMKWVMLPYEDRHFDDRFWMLLGATVLGSLATWGILYVAHRILKSTDLREYDSRDLKGSGLQW